MSSAPVAENAVDRHRRYWLYHNDAVENEVPERQGTA